MRMTYVDLVLDTGELVRIACADKYEDDLYETIETAMKRRDWWAASSFDRCTAEFLGLHLDRVNMGRVVGIL